MVSLSQAEVIVLFWKTLKKFRPMDVKRWEARGEFSKLMFIAVAQFSEWEELGGLV